MSLPLSVAQTEVWRGQKLAPGNALYNIGGYHEIFGAIDRGLFEAALRQAIGEIDTHNSRFVETKDGPRQIFGFKAEFKIPFMDLSREADARATAIAWMQAAMDEPFDLESGPLFRSALIKVADDRSFWFLVFHHIITDLFGAALLYPRVSDLYNTSIDGLERPFEQTSWLEFLNDEQDYRNSPRFKRDQEYWRDSLRGHSSAVTLSGKPPAWPGPTIESRGKISRSLLVELESLGAAQQTSLPTVLYAVTAAYMSRMTGAIDVILGMPVTGRTSGKLRRVPGFLANVVPLRLIVDPDASIGALVRQAGVRTREALRHQRYWASALRADLNLLPADPNICGTAVNFVTNDSALDFAGQSARMTIFTHSSLVEDLGITVHARNDASDIVVQFSAHRDHYDAPTLQRHRERLLQLLESAVRHSDAPLKMLPLLTNSERGLVSKDWTGAGINFDRRTFPEIFAAQAARSPHSTALACGDQKLSYAELNVRADRLARRLMDKGVGAETLVGLCIERSVDMIVAVLGIWKSGAAYLPLDLTYPAERLSLMLDDARPGLIVSSAATMAAAAAWTAKGYPQLVLDSGESHPVAPGAAAIRSPAATDAAYVIYTSGSSGTPKGVLVTHAGIAALAAAQVERFAIGAASRVLQFASLNFDASVSEIVTALSSGATLVLAPADALTGDALRALLAKQSVSHATLPPAVLPTVKPGTDLALQCLVVAGEACPPALVDEWSKRARVINAYGPTECTVCATMSEALHGRAAAPIGKPIAGTRVYVLDDMLEHVAIGAAGEIYIAGAGLARGYLNRPTLTAERFVADPFSEPGSRMYRSGDLARWHGDGQLEFLGRADSQVKIRGFRIELEEIESALLKQEGIEQAAVVPSGGTPSRQYLAAYLVCRAGLEPDPKGLRRALARHLPEHMIPAAFASIAALPLRPNGKLDRRALPVPGDDSRSSGPYEAPSGPKEAAIAAIWSDLLQIERVGRHDSFFELGGNSLLLVDVIERLRLQGWRVEARSIFDEPTVAGLGAVIEPLRVAMDVPPKGIAPNCEHITPAMLPLISLDQAQIDAVVARIAGGARNVEDIYPLAPLQEGILVHHRLSSDTDAYLLSAILSFDTRDRAHQFAAALQVVIDRHDVLRSAIQWEGLPEPVQVVLRQARMPVEEINLRGGSGAEELWSKRRARIDVRKAPLMRMQLAADASQGRWLGLLQFHHLIIDHSTLGLIISEVIAQLDGSDQPSPKTVPFRDFVAESRLGVPPGDHLKFFQQMLRDYDEPAAPFGLLDVRGDGLDIEEARHSLQAKLARAVRSHARRLGVTPSSLFHLAWALVLARTSARDDIVFGTVLFGRMHGAAGLDRAFGLFINTLPFRLRLHELGVTEAVRLTHARLGQLVKHEHASLAAVQRCSALPASAPLFSALLNFRHGGAAVAAAAAAGALGVKLIRAEERTNYPIALFVDDLGVDFALTAQAPRSVDPTRICGFIETALESLLRALEENPTASVRSLPVLSEPERGRVLAPRSGSYGALPSKLFPQQFEAQVMRTPDAIAVMAEGHGLSYAELNASANRVAHSLIDLGVRPGDRVGLCAMRTPSLLVGLLGIQKSGGAYVPLDPEFPVDRLNYMLADSGAKVLLVSGSLPVDLQVPPAVTRLEIDSVADGVAEENPSVATEINHPAYVIYTSGSTGQPKGVAVSHGALLNFLWSMRQRPGLAAGDVLAAVTTVSFDIAALELYLPLTMGARIELVSRHVAADGHALAKLLASAQATTLQATPTTWRLLLRAGWSGGAAFRALCGGEEMTRDLADEILPRVGELWNLYGPTETTVWSAVDRVQRAAEKIVPIGRAIRATRLYVLDGDLEPAPVGAAGELYIAGEGLACGYFNRPALTAERFVPDPHGEPGTRMYRTGDLARWRGDGALEYLGRNDRQVKIRGFRIELGEIEAALRAQASIEQAAVIARRGAGGDYLAAYVVSRGAVETTDLRRALGDRLPDYMMPTVLVPLDKLPLTPNGKIDRAALAAIGDGERSAAGYEAPQGSVEAALAALWAELLQVERVGRHDDFFELGGNSLLLVDLIERLRLQGWSTEVRGVFEHPTVAGLAAILKTDDAAVVVPPNRIVDGCDRITPEMLPLVALDQVQIDAIATRVRGGARNIQDIYPLAPLQEGMLIHHRLTQESDVYLLRVLLAFEAREQAEQFAAALQAVIDRHDVLRTALQWEGLPEPVQVVWRRATLSIEEIDATLDDNAPVDQMWTKRRPRIDVSQAPLMGAQLAHDLSRGWLMLLQFHHLIVDHATLELIMEEVKALLAGQVELLPPSVPFRNFVAQSRLGIPSDDHSSFFRKMLGDVDEPTAPFGLLDVRGDGSQVEEAQISLAPELARRLRAEARRLGVAVSSLFHVAWALLLARTSGRDDVVFGTVLSGRMSGTRAGRTLGLFINTLPLRVQLGMGAARAVRETHAALGRLLRHEHASLAAAQRCSAVPAAIPLFSALLNFRQAHEAVAVAMGVELFPGAKLLRAEERTNYPLGLAVNDHGTEFSLTAQAPASIDAGRICGFVEAALQGLLSALEQNPGGDLRNVPILPGMERDRVLMEWSGTTAEIAATTVPELFERQVGRTPAAIAVSFKGEALTYGELNARADRLAQQLIARGVGPESVVGMVVERSADMMVRLLGILKAGAAYLPLDATYPPERLKFMLEDARPSLVLSSAGAELAWLPAAMPRLILTSGGSADAVPAAGVNTMEAEGPPLDFRHPAYIIYTSGSSGTPKGVVVTHAGIAALAASQISRFGITASARVLQYASLNFDASMSEIVTAFGSGATLVLAPPDALTGHALRGLLVDEGITHVTLPPAVLPTLRPGSDLPLECLVVAGEPCPAALVAQWSNSVRMVNAYGPTETTVCATMSKPLRHVISAPIGRPIDATRVYVLDGALQPVPIGVAGELYIAGASLARGYLHRPGSTADRFVADPYGLPGSRMYRSGDLVRWRHDGELDYLGRADDQVKIRGFRVELAEIEAVLRTAPGIREAAVMAPEDPGGRYLAAYVVPADVADDRAHDGVQLRRFLAQRLPAYMIPTSFISIAALPLTPSGKVDRRALPAPEGARRSSRAHEPPQTRTEEQLAHIWRDILRAETIGRTDDFFELGGHSLTALQVASRARDAFGVELPLINLFEARTLAALAEQIDRAVLSKEFTPRLAALRSLSGDEPAPLSYSQERMWLIQSLNPGTTAYNMASCVRLQGAVDLAALSTSYDDLIRRHDILRTSIRMIDDQPMQIVGPWTGPPLQIIDLRGVENAEAKANEQALLEARTPFDLSREPVLRAQLFQLDGDVHIMNLVLHHIAADQWSMGVLGRELAALYNSRRRGLSIQLAALPINYRDYSIWQRSEGFASEFRRQLAFWHRQLAELPTVDLATDFPRPPVWTLNGTFYDRQISPELFARIEQFGRGAGSTLFMTLFAAFATLLHRLTGQRDIPIGVPVANRSHSLMEGLVGTFVNTVVMRNDLTGDPGFSELLQRVRITALEAFSQQDVSFDRLVQELGQRGDRSRAPLVQVLFNVTNAPMHDVDFDAVTLKALPMDRGGAQFELSFSIDTEFTHKLSIEYNTDLFEHATIERLAAQYLTLLEAATVEPLCRISMLPLLPAEQRATLRAWNSTSAAYPRTEMFPRIFEAQARKSPQAIAVSFAGSQMSYAELNASANILARQLCELGAKPGTLVGLCVSRSPLLLISLLAIQKSGAGYVPLDPEFPAERLSYMLIDSGSELLLTSGELPAGVEAPAAVRILDAATAIKNAAVSAENLERAAAWQDVAYVIYTSGSTGRPKGVAIAHGALLNFLCSMRERPGLSSADVLAAVTTISFDIAALELYLPLMVGARIELVPRQDSGDGHALSSLLGSSGTTVLQATPATWRMLLEVEWSGTGTFRALCGGEPLSRELADGILERVGELWNMYGPTETTVWSTLERVQCHAAAISIGRPIGNTQMHILDAGGQPVPIGAAGEICIGGEGVANGYHRRPALTAERFVPDIDAGAGRRMYRTGDRGRWAGDGKLYHLGRLDNQVKIRGFRIELNEIEAVFGSYEEVRQVVVVVRDAQADDARLVAFVTYHEGQDLTTGDVKRKLRLQLPEYMIPSIVVPVASMPLTPNGKVDRASLPNPFDNAVRAMPGRQPPATATERIIADIWKTVLKVEQIDAEDNFFELGGYSLLSLRVAKMVKKRTGHAMDPRTLFFHNLRQVAALLESA